MCKRRLRLVPREAGGVTEPHAYEDARPLIDWAVMQDPFGNEFCLVRELTRSERDALAAAAEQGPAEDAHWRAVARSARSGGR